ncbi:ketopantoate reductase family protein [Dyadobacter fanqingshengii]|uniref:2-dehydropantoate 2-reductase n=1 Tax=Dyadobacter fanqingshengii TaxID=2906443 RepID=A0A9X1PC00_9BACT|nr:2-dehydropantoate 2-reductase [Dyadobacter fanqingshengii]MCF0041414.1 2-dehydropantoate 2-reductase [Dyadobacter fanqingshengii]USJ36865.1 2-dehydropantoate 2-reductase [Dyadobacter fanqingshengii]
MHLHSDHIYIIGSGAIGKALAVFLKLSGRKATLIRGSVNDGDQKIEHIRVQMPDGTMHEADITISTLNAFPTLHGIIVLANKSFGNEALAVALKNKTGSSPIVLMQNGLGVERPFFAQDFPEIYRCVLFVTSQIMDETLVRFKPVATCPVGIERGDVDCLQRLVTQLTTSQFVFKNEADIQHTIWKKAIVNCVFNSVCPLLSVDNGIFYRNEAALDIARRVIAECNGVANAKGILLSSNDIEGSLLQISRASDGQLISTLQDIRAGRRTEIDTLNFEIVKMAGELGLVQTVKETKLLGELVKLKAEINLNRNLETIKP